jgi:PASTA domain
MRWLDGFDAFRRLRRWHDGGSRDGGDALDALSDIGAVRRLLDQAELAAVRAARSRSKSWAEIATRLGVTRQSAWERWRDLDEEPAEPSTDAVSAEEQAIDLAAAAIGESSRARRTRVLVPDVVGLEWDTARRVLSSDGLRAAGADPDAPPPSPESAVVDQKPVAGESVPAGSTVLLWFGRGPGSAGVREPLHPRPSPRATGGAIDETTGTAIP